MEMVCWLPELPKLTDILLMLLQHYLVPLSHLVIYQITPMLSLMMMIVMMVRTVLQQQVIMVTMKQCCYHHYHRHLRVHSSMLLLLLLVLVLLVLMLLSCNLFTCEHSSHEHETTRCRKVGVHYQPVGADVDASI
jgi:hypothetical protein